MAPDPVAPDAVAPEPVAGRVYLHIGLQKTGTSYLQGILFASVAALADQGVALVPATRRESFQLMLDVRGRYRPEVDPPRVAHAVDDFAAALADVSSPVALVTEESLAPADDEQIRRLLAACGEREVHLVVTLRDLARQIPSAWQESLKAGASETFDSYLRRLRRREGEAGHPLWRQKDVVHLLTTWTRHVPASRVHLVTVPPPGSDPGLLLRRFCVVIDVDPETLEVDVLRKNESLKHVGAEVLRRVNERLAPEHRTRDVYGDVGKRYLSTRILAQQDGARIAVPATFREWTTSVSQRHVDHLRQGEYDVVGDLGDLLPGAEAFSSEATGPGDPSEDEVGAVAVAALATVIGDEMDRRRASRGTATEPGGSPAPRGDDARGVAELARRVGRRIRRPGR